MEEKVEENHSEGTELNQHDQDVQLAVDETKRKEAIGNMERIEKEFAAIKEKFFADKIEAIDKEYEALENATHQVIRNAFLQFFIEINIPPTSNPICGR
jgi:hypothetical protein